MAKVIRLAAGVLALILLSAACSASDPAKNGETVTDTETWQDYYDLGVRYLSEGNYQEAIIAFTAAIEIDDKQPLAYIGRGDAYMGMSNDTSGGEEVSKNLRHAVDDYLAAVKLDGRISETYKKLADIYVSQGNIKAAIEILEKGISATGNEELKQYREQMDADDGESLDEQGENQTTFFGNQYFDLDFAGNVPTIGGKSMAETSFDEAVAYFGAKVGEGYENILVADVRDSGPIDSRSGLGVHIQYHLEDDTLSVFYPPYGRNPEFMGILQGDPFSEVLNKLGITEEGMRVLSRYPEWMETESGIQFWLEDVTTIAIHWSHIYLHTRIEKSFYAVNISIEDGAVWGVSIQCQHLK